MLDNEVAFGAVGKFRRAFCLVELDGDLQQVSGASLDERFQMILMLREFLLRNIPLFGQIVMAVFRPVQSVENGHSHVEARAISTGTTIVMVLCGVFVHRGENELLLLRIGVSYAVVSCEVRVFTCVEPFTPVVEQQPFDGQITIADLFALLLVQLAMPLFRLVFDGIDFLLGSQSRRPAIATVPAIQTVDQKRHSRWMFADHVGQGGQIRIDSFLPLDRPRLLPTPGNQRSSVCTRPRGCGNKTAVSGVGVS